MTQSSNRGWGCQVNQTPTLNGAQNCSGCVPETTFAQWDNTQHLSAGALRVRVMAAASFAHHLCPSVWPQYPDNYSDDDEIVVENNANFCVSVCIGSGPE